MIHIPWSKVVFWGSIIGGIIIIAFIAAIIYNLTGIYRIRKHSKLDL